MTRLGNFRTTDAFKHKFIYCSCVKQPKLFGTNGVRGVFPADLTLQKIHDITASFAIHVKKGPVLVGYDGRASSSIIARTVCATLNAYGIQCKNAGLVPTPCLEYGVKKFQYTAGVMVTASHNPPQYNGVKICAADGVEISREDESVIQDIYFEKRWPIYRGAIAETHSHDVIPAYIKGVISQLDAEKIKSKKLTVILDIGNGAQAVAAPEMCARLGCNVSVINEDIDGSFPGRGSEPTVNNLGRLSEAVTANNADIGIAFDGDGDRSMFCDDAGNIMSGDKSALLLARHITSANPGSKIVTCLNSSNVIDGIAAECGASVTRTRVGSVEVSRCMVDTGADVGFEENGGFMFARHNQVRDGLMTLGLALGMLADADMTISQIASSLPPLFTAKDKIPCDAQQAAHLIDALKKEHPGADGTDGIKIATGPDSWVMIRPSGTEPIVRVYAEGGSAEDLEQLIAKYIQKIRAIISR